MLLDDGARRASAATAATAPEPPAPPKRSKYEKKKARVQRRKAAAQLAAAEAATALAITRNCPPWLASPELLARANDRAMPLADRLGEEVAAFDAYTQRVVRAARPPIDAAIEQIARVVAAVWPQARVTRFGSFATGLWLPSSDVDVVVMDVLPPADADADADAATAPGDAGLSDVEALEAIADGLRGQTHWVARISVVRGAKVPVAKLELRGGRRVDISIENSHTRRGVEASELVSAYAASLPELRPLVFVLKQFLREKALNDAFTGGLSSYAVTLMAVFLLQQMRPAGDEDAAAAEEPEASKRQPPVRTGGASPTRRLGEALLEFVEYFGLHFSYAGTGLSLRPEAFGAYLLMDPLLLPGLMPQLVIDDPVYAAGQHNAAAGAFAIARVAAALEDAHYALRFHRATRFTPTPLSQLLHWSGHAPAASS